MLLDAISAPLTQLIGAEQLIGADLGGSSLLEYALLGVVQGITEFLPVSSSGHLAILEHFFEVPAGLSLSIAAHFGTLLATLIVMRQDVLQLLRDLWALLRAPKTQLQTPGGKMIAAIVIATLPTGIAGLLIHDAMDELQRQMLLVGAGLLVTAILVVSTRFSKGARMEDAAAIPTALQALLIGCAQSIALMPGISRSGSTIAAAMICGIAGPAAFRFSFLISLPAIVGAVLLEMLGGGLGFDLSTGVVGVVSLVVGLGGLLLLRGVVQQGRFWIFACYLVPAGIAVICFLS